MKYLLRDLIFQFIHKDNILKSRNQFNPLIYGVGERLIVSYAKKNVCNKSFFNKQNVSNCWHLATMVTSYLLVSGRKYSLCKIFFIFLIISVWVEIRNVSLNFYVMMQYLLVTTYWHFKAFLPLTPWLRMYLSGSFYLFSFTTIKYL